MNSFSPTKIHFRIVWSSDMWIPDIVSLINKNLTGDRFKFILLLLFSLTLLWPHGLQPARVLCPWNFPGKNTGVGCHFPLRGSSWPRDQTLIFLNWQVGSLPLRHLAQPACQCRRPKRRKRCRFYIWDGKISWRRSWQPILSWRIPWAEEPGRLQPMELQRVGHAWSELACTHASGKQIYIHIYIYIYIYIYRERERERAGYLVPIDVSIYLVSILCM